MYVILVINIVLIEICNSFMVAKCMLSPRFNLCVTTCPLAFLAWRSEMLPHRGKKSGQGQDVSLPVVQQSILPAVENRLFYHNYLVHARENS